MNQDTVINKHKNEEVSNEKQKNKGNKPLSIPSYTKEQLLNYTNVQIQTIKERAELKDLADLVLMCLEVLEEKNLLDALSGNKKKHPTSKKADSNIPRAAPPRVRPENSSAISWYFHDLGAPLINTVWSWGAISLKNQVVFLRVWGDEIKVENGIRLVQLTLHSRFRGKKNLGYEERLRHIENIKNKSCGFAIICEAVDIKKTPRKIKSYDREKLYPILKIIEIEGDDWGELGSGELVSEYLS